MQATYCISDMKFFFGTKEEYLKSNAGGQFTLAMKGVMKIET